MTEYRDEEERTVRADCKHLVVDPLELTEFEGRRLCPDCYAYRDELQD